MTFIIALLLGLYLGFKLKSAIYLFKDVRNVKFIEATVNKILDSNDITIIRSKIDIDSEKENKELEKEHKKFKLKRVSL